MEFIRVYRRDWLSKEMLKDKGVKYKVKRSKATRERLLVIKEKLVEERI